MTQPLVTQLKFTRSEWVRGLKPVTAEEATRRFGAINPISWMIGHLAWQEQLYWVERAQETLVVPSTRRGPGGARSRAQPTGISTRSRAPS